MNESRRDSERVPRTSLNRRSLVTQVRATTAKNKSIEVRKSDENYEGCEKENKYTLNFSTMDGHWTKGSTSAAGSSTVDKFQAGRAMLG